MDRRAFTLIELLVVMAIMAVLAMLTLPFLAPLYRSHKLDSGMMGVQGLVMHARSLAATKNEVHYVSFNTLTPTQHMLVIYGDARPLGGASPTDWVSTVPNANSAIATEPMILDEAVNLYVNGQAHASDLYLRCGPLGQTVLVDNTPMVVDNLAPQPYPDSSSFGIVRREALEKYQDDGEPIDESQFRVLHVMHLTGEFYKE